MKKVYLLFLASVIVIITKAQHFEWGVNMGSAETETLTSVVDAQGNITTLVAWHVRERSASGELHHVYEATGDSTRLEHDYHHMLVLLQFNKEGKLNWQKCMTSANRSNLPGVAHLTAHPGGKISLFIHTGNPLHIYDDTFESMIAAGNFVVNKQSKIIEDEEEEENYEGEFNGHDNSFDQHFYDDWYGLLQIDFSPAGKLLHIARFLPEDLLEINGIVADGKGGHIITTHIEEDVVLGKYTIKGKKDGIHIIVRIDSLGNILSVQPIKYVSKTSYISPYPYTAIVGNKIFMAGQINDNPTNGKGYSDSHHSFAAAFDLKGKILWLKLSDKKSTLYSLHVDDKNIFISGNTYGGDKIFGMNADTTGLKRGFVLALNAKNGDSRWIQTSNIHSFKNLATDTNGNIYGLGNYTITDYKKPAWFHTDTLPDKFDNLLLASYDAKGNYRWMKAFNSYLHNTNEYCSLLADKFNNLYITSTAFVVIDMKASFMDKAFLNGRAYGNMAYCVKIIPQPQKR